MAYLRKLFFPKLPGQFFESSVQADADNESTRPASLLLRICIIQTTIPVGMTMLTPMETRTKSAITLWQAVKISFTAYVSFHNEFRVTPV